MLVTATDLAVGFAILAALGFSLVFILDHIGGGEPYFDWNKLRVRK